jgi:exonuclease VII small subunit
MVDVSAEVGRLSELDELTGPAAAAVLESAGWTGERRNPAKEWATTWRRGDAHAWIQGDGPSVQVEFTLWYREVEEEWPDPDTYLDDLYDTASAELPRIVAQLESGALGRRLESSDEDLTDGADYIDHTAWLLSDKVLLAGVKHDDTEAPVQLVVVVRDRGEGVEGDEGEWL